jgi:hypothetical protein
MLRPETTKSGKGRVVPLATTRLRAVLEWLQLQADGEKKPDAALVFSNETGECIGSFRTVWITAVLKAPHRESRVENVWLDCTDTGLSRAVPAHQSALARPPARVRLAAGRALCAALAGARPARTRLDRHHRAVRQSAAGRLQVAAGKLESGKLFHPPTLGSGTEFRISLTTVRRAGPWNPSPQSTTSVSCCKNNQLRIGWEAGIRARSRRAEGEPRRA